MKNNNTGLPETLCQSLTIGESKVKFLLCDDNPAFLDAFRVELGSILKKHEIEGELRTYESPERIPEKWMQDCDIFFLDIDFAGKPFTGIHVAQQVRQINPDAVIIFVTNFAEYAPEGYEVQAFRYLLKRELRTKLEDYFLQAYAKWRTVRQTIRITVQGQSLTVPLADILYIEAQGHNVLLYAQQKGAQKQAYRYYSSLAEMEQRLERQGFLRIQKSYLVNMSRIQKLQCTCAVLDNEEALPVSKKSYAQQKQQYLLWKGRK